MFVPAATPDAIVDKLYRTLERVMQDPEVRQRIAATSALMPQGTPAQFRAFVEQELARWRTVIQNAGIRLQ